MAIRYLVVVDRAAPSPKAPTLGALPADVLAGLAEQLDLKLVSRDGNEVIYENAAWGPGRARLAGSRPKPNTVAAGDLAGARPALLNATSPLRFAGDVATGDTVYFAEAASSNWRLDVGGRRRRGDGRWGGPTPIRSGAVGGPRCTTTRRSCVRRSFCSNCSSGSRPCDTWWSPACGGGARD